LLPENAVQQITDILIRETVPDSVFDHADEIELVYINPDELLKRLSEGKVYLADKAQSAVHRRAVLQTSYPWRMHILFHCSRQIRRSVF
jgi:hypothetical protein